MADGQEIARSWNDFSAVPVGVLCVDYSDSWLARQKWKFEGNRLSASLHAGVGGGCASWGNFVRHECSGCAGSTASAGSGRSSLSSAVSASGFDPVHTLFKPLVRVGTFIVVDF